MITIPSLTFGDIEIDEATVFNFPDGIPGLRNIKRYALVESDELAPFVWLQACDDPFLSLMTIHPQLIKPDYQISFSEEHRKAVGEFEPKDLVLAVLVVVPKDPTQMTANLLAPILLNRQTRLGAQVVIDGTREMLRVKVIQN